MTSSDAISGSAASPPAPPETVAPVPEPGTPADGAAEPGTPADGAAELGTPADGGAEVGTPAPGGPALPEQSREDTDAAWGEYQEPADDHLYRDRPPHWDDF
jgi:hypothetical protein